MSDYVMSDQFGNTEELQHVETSLPDLRKQVKVLGSMYNHAVDDGMSTNKQQLHDGFMHWLSEIVEALEQDEVVVVEVVE